MTPTDLQPSAQLLEDGSKRSRPRKLGRTPPEARPESTDSIDGGVAISHDDTKKRRRPRKLNRTTPNLNPAPTQPVNETEPGDIVGSGGLDTEVEALKTRVQHLEAQIQELYNRPTGKGSARRRGRKNKSSAGQSSTAATATATEAETEPEQPGQSEQLEKELEPSKEQEDDDKELTKLEDDLDEAKAELAALTRVPRRARSGRASTNATPTEDDVEEIPRTTRPGVQPSRRKSSQQVTLSGSYRIPLPENVSMDDVKAIQDGVRSAGAFARGLYDASRKAQQESAAREHAGGRRSSSNFEVIPDTDNQRKNWSQWIGGYSMSIARFVNNLNHDVALESGSNQAQQPKRTPMARSRSDGASGASRATPSPSTNVKNRSRPKQAETVRPKTVRGGSGKA